MIVDPYSSQDLIGDARWDRGSIRLDSRRDLHRRDKTQDTMYYTQFLASTTNFNYL